MRSPRHPIEALESTVPIRSMRRALWLRRAVSGAIAVAAGVGLLGSSTNCDRECTLDAECDLGDPCAGAFCDDGACDYAPIPDGGECDGGACNAHGVCVRCGVDAQDEPNDTPAQAVDVGLLGDCASLSYEGSTAEGSDDWVTFHGVDASCNVLTKVSVIARTALGVCVYWTCDVATISADTCPAGATEDTAPNGAFGCCGTRSLAVDPCPDPFQDSSAQVWIRVLPPLDPDCVDYELDVQF